MRFNNGIAIAVLAGEVDLHRYGSHAFDHEFASETCVPAGSTGRDIDLAKLLHFRIAYSRSGQRYMTRAVDARLNGFPHRFGLLVDFLEHVVRKAVLVGSRFAVRIHEFLILANLIGSFPGEPPTHHRVYHFAFRREQNKISIVANREFALAFGSNQSRRISSSKGRALLQGPAREAHYIAHGPIEREDAPSQLSLEFAPISMHLHLERPELICSVRHSSGADCICNEYGSVYALGLQKHFDNRRSNMDTIRDDVSH